MEVASNPFDFEQRNNSGDDQDADKPRKEQKEEILDDDKQVDSVKVVCQTEKRKTDDEKGYVLKKLRER